MGRTPLHRSSGLLLPERITKSVRECAGCADSKKAGHRFAFSEASNQFSFVSSSSYQEADKHGRPPAVRACPLFCFLLLRPLLACHNIQSPFLFSLSVCALSHPVSFRPFLIHLRFAMPNPIGKASLLPAGTAGGGPVHSHNPRLSR